MKLMCSVTLDLWFSALLHNRNSCGNPDTLSIPQPLSWGLWGVPGDTGAQSKLNPTALISPEMGTTGYVAAEQV
jgi:hypothetical protein